MKKPNRYVCRKCNRSKFKSSMEFTKHLKKCKGPAQASAMDTAVAMMGTMQKSSVKQLEVVSMLKDVSQKTGELKAIVDQVLKRQT